MNVLKATEMTVDAMQFAFSKYTWFHRFRMANLVNHCIGMRSRMKAMMDVGTMSYGKQCRWLGYIQGVCEAYGLLTLDQMKEINKNCQEDDTEGIEPALKDAFRRIEVLERQNKDLADRAALEVAIRDTQIEELREGWRKHNAKRT